VNPDRRVRGPEEERCTAVAKNAFLHGPAKIWALRFEFDDSTFFTMRENKRVVKR